jgi:hypothetical protein
MAERAGGYVSRLLGEDLEQRQERVKGRKLRVDTGLGLPDGKVAVIGDFVNYCCKDLGIEGGFELHLVADRHHHRIMTTAFCDPDLGIMNIFCKNRALPDVLRSIGHELTHLRQSEKGEIGPHPVRYAGGYLEDDANARSGTMLKIFAKTYGMDKVYDG